jgi:hypothetical protein
VPSEAFWSRCDGILAAGGDLVRAYGQLAAARGARRSDAADRDQAERTARVTARLLAVQTAGAIGPTADHVDTAIRTDKQILGSAGPVTSLSAPATPSPLAEPARLRQAHALRVDAVGGDQQAEVRLNMGRIDSVKASTESNCEGPVVHFNEQNSSGGPSEERDRGGVRRDRPYGLQPGHWECYAS